MHAIEQTDVYLDQSWLADLLTGYTVEDMSFAPADHFDLARMLNDGDGIDPGGTSQTHDFGSGGTT
jgi:hypothetical protein